MIMVESRFRVANHMEREVCEAFRHRPALVDDVAGFLGMDVYTAEGDDCLFHLVTRWTDRASYDTWHGGDAHRASHAFIPKGLKLDAAFTRLTVLHRLEPADETPPLFTSLADAAPALAQWLMQAEVTYALLLAPDVASGTVNRALAERLGVPCDASVSMASILANEEAELLAHRVTRWRGDGLRGTKDVFLVNMVNADHSPFTLRCRIDVQPHAVLLLGEDAEPAGDQLRDSLIGANNQLAVLAREREGQRRALDEMHAALAKANTELAATLAALDSSYWHIQRIHEMLPVCLECGDVKSADGSWQTVRDFLMANAKSPFLSHGYCPACAASFEARLERGELDT